MGQVLVLSAAHARAQLKYQIVNLDQGSDTGLALTVNSNDLEFDLLSEDASLRLRMNALPLATKKTYPQNYKIDAYRLVSGQKQIINTVSPLLLSDRQAANSRFTIQIGEIEAQEDIYLDVYDASGILVNVYSLGLTAINVPDQVNPSELTAADCAEDVFDDCQLKYILQNVSFLARPSKTSETSVYKELDGKYTVAIPLMKKNGADGTTGAAY